MDKWHRAAFNLGMAGLVIALAVVGCELVGAEAILGPPERD
jgi:hypothetical protein